MNKKELAVTIASRTSGTTKTTMEMIDAFTETVTEALKRGEAVRLVGFGIFEARKRASRRTKNPRTGAQMNIPASIAPAFKAGKGLKDALK